eukprot:NODE_14966_length_1075_cov_9.780591.p1 GENE.NODE_14966_length_1075_cov_9.780591~~NODE_14966_length_1075_cov_9.780591.p1  ORF type:complete len:263 (-),score=52.74 NODE_14966_length_1075_cov_9.780591:285-977(-)
MGVRSSVLTIQASTAETPPVSAAAAAAGAAAAVPGSAGGNNSPRQAYSVLQPCDETLLEPYCWLWLGRICVVRLPHDFFLYIGPHWYCAAAMLVFIIGVGCFFVKNVAIHNGWLHVLGGLFATLISTGTFLKCALADPGVLRRREGDEEALVAEPPAQQKRMRQCETCKLPQPRGTSHCGCCQVCIEGFDHHCPWTGKCVGRKNASLFYGFIIIAFSSLGFIVADTVLIH